MPTDAHEAVILLFRNRPRLAVELLGQALGIQVPRFTEARIASSDRTEAKPATFLADLVVELRTSVGTQAAIIVEMQRQRDERKRAVRHHPRRGATRFRRRPGDHARGCPPRRGSIRHLYCYVLSAPNDAARARLEAEMKLGNYPEPTDLEKRILARGRAAGLAEGEAEAILTVLESRGIELSAPIRERIASCRDLELLRTWLVRAVTVERAEEVVEPG